MSSPRPASAAGPVAGAGPLFFGLVGEPNRPPRPRPARRLVNVLLRAANRLLPKDPTKVVLHSTIDLEDGVLAVAQELAGRGLLGTVLLEDDDNATRLQAAVGAPVRALSKRSARGLWHFLTARFVVTTEQLYGGQHPPASQVLVNIWHGEPGGKVVGRFRAVGPHTPGTIAPVTSTVGRAYRSAGFGLDPLRVPVIGAARNDRMLRSDAAAVRAELLGTAGGLTTFLWLPSFRSGESSIWRRVDVVNHHPGLPFPVAEVRQLDDWLLEHDARIVVKPHPHDRTVLPGSYRAIRVLCQGEMNRRGLTLYPMLPAFDALITDISSVWFDYLLLDKPMIFAFPDIDAYREGRGLSLEPFEQWLPGPFVRDLDGVLAALSAVVSGADPMAAERGLARLRFHTYQDDRSTARLLDGLGLAAAAAQPRTSSARS